MSTFNTADAYTSQAQAGVALVLAVGGENFVQPTMSDGMGPDWPFGTAYLIPFIKFTVKKNCLKMLY